MKRQGLLIRDLTKLKPKLDFFSQITDHLDMAGAKLGSKPDIFSYHDYRVFLKDWLRFLKKRYAGFTAKSLAQSAEISEAALSRILSGSLELSLEILSRLKPHLRLSAKEFRYLHQLVIIAESQDPETRDRAFTKIKRVLKRVELQPEELESHQLLSKWYYAFILQIAELPDFKLDPKWIQERLVFPVHLKELKTAIDFLVDNGFLVKGKGNKIQVKKKPEWFEGGFHQIVLHEFHSQMLELQKRAISEVDRSDRLQKSYSVSVNPDDVQEIFSVLDAALQKIEKIGKKRDQAKTPSSSVFHVSLGAFPVAQVSQGDKKESA